VVFFDNMGFATGDACVQSPLQPDLSTPGLVLHGSAGRCGSNASVVEFVDDHLPQASTPHDELLSVVLEVEVQVRATVGTSGLSREVMLMGVMCPNSIWPLNCLPR
jgi:hypothetical protein